MFDDRIGLGRKADDQTWARAGVFRNGGQNVGVFREFQRRGTARAILLHLGTGGIGNAPVRHGGRHHGRIHRQGGLHGLQHLAGGFHPDHLNALRRRHAGRAGHEHHLRPQIAQRRRQRRALRPGRAVGNIAHRINRLMRRTRGHKNAPPRQRAIRQFGFDGVKDVCGLDHAPRPEFAAGHRPGNRPDHPHAIGQQRGQVALRCRMFPHPHVHGGRDHHRLVRRHQQRRGQIVSMAPCHLGHQIGRRRHNHHQIGGARQLDMAHLGLFGQVEQIEVHLVPGQRPHGQGRHELRPRPRQHRHDRGTPFPQLADQIHRLERGNAAPDDQKDALACDHAALSLPARPLLSTLSPLTGMPGCTAAQETQGSNRSAAWVRSIW